MKTQIYDVRGISDEKELEIIMTAPAKTLAEGGVVAFPTETVYGLGGNAFDDNAVERIFAAKGRPSDNPLIVHIAHKAQLKEIVKAVPQKAEPLMNRFWPGSLSIIMKRTDRVPDCVTAGLDTVAIRMPINPEARVLLSICGCPVAAPSANLSGKPSPTRPQHVVHDLDGRIDAIIMGRDCDVGIESTVIDLTVEPPVILRPGIVTKEEIEAEIGPVLMAGRREKTEIPKAPGMKYTHYAPDAPLIVYEGSGNNYYNAILSESRAAINEGKRIAVLAADESLEKLAVLRAESPEKCSIFCLGSALKPETIAYNLFDLLRKCDDEGFDLILAEAAKAEGTGFSVMNRMDKAAVQIRAIAAD